MRAQSVSPMLDKFTRVGLMARDSLTNPASRHVMMTLNAENSFQVLVRAVAGATTTSLPPDPLPTAFGSNSWLRFATRGHGVSCLREQRRHGLGAVVSIRWRDGDGRAVRRSDISGHRDAGAQFPTTVTAVLSGFGVTPTVPVNVTVAFALLEYRRHDYAKAAEWSRRCLAHPEYNAARVAAARLAILALALQQLGETAEAQTQVNQSRELIEKKFRTSPDLGGGAWILV